MPRSLIINCIPCSWGYRFGSGVLEIIKVKKKKVTLFMSRKYSESNPKIIGSVLNYFASLQIKIAIITTLPLYSKSCLNKNPNQKLPNIVAKQKSEPKIAKHNGHYHANEELPNNQEDSAKSDSISSIKATRLLFSMSQTDTANHIL